MLLVQLSSKLSSLLSYLHIAPSAGSVELVTVDVVSSTSVNVSWLPTSRDNWNGIITHYTVEYRLIRSVRDMNGVSGSGVAPTVPGSGVAPAMYASIPALGQPLANNPNPTLVTIPLKRESVLITGLHEFSVYQFSIYYENSVGRSDINSPLEQATAAAGNVNTSSLSLAITIFLQIKRMIQSSARNSILPIYEWMQLSSTSHH